MVGEAVVDCEQMSQVLSDLERLSELELRQEHWRRLCRRQLVPFCAHTLLPKGKAPASPSHLAPGLIHVSKRLRTRHGGRLAINGRTCERRIVLRMTNCRMHPCFPPTERTFEVDLPERQAKMILLTLGN